MKIPQKLYQFSDRPALLVVSGEFEAHFYSAFNGSIERVMEIVMHPREEAREKQGYSHGMGVRGVGAVGHHGAYVQELKHKYFQQMGRVIDGVLSAHNISEVYIFAPRYAEYRIFEHIRNHEKLLVNEEIFGEYINHSPLEVLARLQKKLDEKKARKD